MKITKNIDFKREEGIHGINTLFDNQFKAAFNITDDEMDLICTAATDDELNILITNQPTFSEKRQIIEVLRKYVKK